MLIVPGRCVKCPTKIVAGVAISELYEEIDCRTSDGSTVVIGVCRNCAIEPSEIPELSRVMTESMQASGYKGEVVITDIVRRKNLAAVLHEIQSEKCYNCDDVLGPEFGISHSRAVHLVCPKDKPGTSETPADKKIEVRHAQKLVRKGRLRSPEAGRNDVQKEKRLVAVRG